MGASRGLHLRLRAALALLPRPLLLAVLATLLFRLAVLPLLLPSYPQPEPSLPHTSQGDITQLPSPPATTNQEDEKEEKQTLTKALVIATTSTLPANETSWISAVPRDGWSVHVYVTDVAPPSSSLPFPSSLLVESFPDTTLHTVPSPKGNEAMAYLTYITSHYDALPDVVLFRHAHARAWHQPSPLSSSLEETVALRAGYVAARGYVSARCLPGCENVLPLAGYTLPLDAMGERGVGRDVRLSSLLDAFLNGDDEDEGGKEKQKQKTEKTLPRVLSAPCCAQFAASRAAILARPRAFWARLRQWLIDTPLPSAESGRLLEYTWHVWLGEEAYLCPDYEACRCHVYGIGEDCERYFELEKAM